MSIRQILTIEPFTWMWLKCDPIQYIVYIVAVWSYSRNSMHVVLSVVIHKWLSNVMKRFGNHFRGISCHEMLWEMFHQCSVKHCCSRSGYDSIMLSKQTNQCIECITSNWMVKPNTKQLTKRNRCQIIGFHSLENLFIASHDFRTEMD